MILLNHHRETFTRLHRVEELAIEEDFFFLLAGFGFADLGFPLAQCRRRRRRRAAFALHGEEDFLTLRRASWQLGDLRDQLALARSEPRVLQAVPLLPQARQARALAADGRGEEH